ncbi:MAG: hypothetical protein ACK5B9_10915 [Flavobacteriia bacterium]|jgi:OOP family OmpA-OmpF porin
MKLTVIIFLLLLSQFTLSQLKSNRFSNEIEIGISTVVSTLTDGFYAKAGSLSTNYSNRFMMNDRFGIKAEFNYNQFNFGHRSINLADTNLVDKTNYYRTSIIGVTNLGNVLNFKSKTDRFGLLMHTGGGFSILQSKNTLQGVEWKSDFSDIMINLVLGFSPQIKIGPRMAANVNILMISHLSQTFTFDMNSSAKRQGFDGVIFNFGAGISYYFGPHLEHFDWSKKM